MTDGGSPILPGVGAGRAAILVGFVSLVTKRSRARAVGVLLSALVAAAAWSGHGGAVAIARAAAGNPSANRTLSRGTFAACFGHPSSRACVVHALGDINAARVSEGVVPMVLPTGFGSLSLPLQLLVIANLERVDRGLAPALGLAASLDRDAAAAVDADADPTPSAMYGDVWSSNWAGGLSSPLEADFVWMYDDGFGSGNGDCRSPTASGCWAHRHDILARFGRPIAMGAAAGTGAYGPSLDELFVGRDRRTGAGQPDAPLPPTWSAIAARLPLGVTPAALRLGRGASSGSIEVSASGAGMSVSASITGRGLRWQVSPRHCRLAPGGRCELTVSVSGTGGTGTGTGTLKLSGPHTVQNVALTVGYR